MLDAHLLPEYEALTTRAGVVRLDRSRVIMTGRDRATLLHKFCTQDVLGKTPGEGGEAFLCNVQGKIVAYVYFFVDAEQIILDSAAGQAAAIIKHLDRYVITEDVQFSDESAKQSDLLLAGLQVEAILGDVGMPLPAMLGSHVLTQVGGPTVRIARVPLAQTPAWLVSVSVEDVANVEATIVGVGVTPCSPAAAEILRIEAAAPLFGTDITVENLPQEVNRNDAAIHFRKGCYLGQETVARIDALGHVNKLLVAVKFTGDTVPAPGQELKLDDKVVGRVTSAVYSPRHQAPLALAYVRREHSTSGTKLEGAEVV